MPDFSALRAAIERCHLVKAAADYRALLDVLTDVRATAPVMLDFLNQHAGNLIMSDAHFRSAFFDADIILRDGIGVRLAMKLLGRGSGLNMNGTDFIPALIADFSRRHPQAPILVFGTREPWLENGTKRLTGMHAGPLVLLDGFQDAAHYCEAAVSYSHIMKLVLLGMGMPKQELIAQRLKAAAIGPTLIVCGGAIIDFAAGKVARAPGWMRASGLEWLYRLVREPRRLFKRYVIGIPFFLSCVVLSRLQMRLR